MARLKIIVKNKKKLALIKLLTKEIKSFIETTQIKGQTTKVEGHPAEIER